MRKFSRRWTLRGSVGLVAAATLGRPIVANAAATTITVWWPQGFVREEDVGFREVIAGYEKASGNKIDLTLIPFAPLMQKIVGALTIGDLPDVMGGALATGPQFFSARRRDELIDESAIFTRRIVAVCCPELVEIVQ